MCLHAGKFDAWAFYGGKYGYRQSSEQCADGIDNKQDKSKQKRDTYKAKVGEDCCAVDFGKDVCVLSSDPITGAVNEVGRLAVHGILQWTLLRVELSLWGFLWQFLRRRVRKKRILKMSWPNCRYGKFSECWYHRRTYRDYHCRKQDSDNQHCGGKGIKGQAGYYIRGKAGRWHYCD